MTPETAAATIKNPRWWLVIPILLPVTVAWLFVGWLLYKPLWWMGQTLCGLSNAMSPSAATPAAIKTMMDWARNRETA